MKIIKDGETNKQLKTIDSYYNWGLIEGNTVKLFNDSTINFCPRHTDALEDVNIQITDNGNLQMTAKVIIYDFYIGHKIWEDEWELEPDPKLIKEGKKYWWSRKKTRYVIGGWIRTMGRETVSFLMSNYKVEIYD